MLAEGGNCSAAARLQVIQFPILWVAADVYANAVQFRFITDYMFPIISLPDIMYGGIAPHPLCYPDFETTNNRTDVF